MAEAGATPAQEIAFTIANAKEYVRAAIAAGLDVDDFAPRLSFFFVARTTMLEEIAKFRAARRIWARIMRDEFGAKNPKSQMLRFHTQTAGVQLTAQQPEVNLVRVAVQALAAVLGGTQSLHTNSFDEAIALPTEKAARLALRTQQVIAYETDVTKIVDPFAGSYAIESLTDDLEAAALALIQAVEDRGGAVAAIEQGFQKNEIEAAAYRVAQEIDDGTRTVVGRQQVRRSPTRSPTSRCASTRRSRPTSASASPCCARERDNDAVTRAPRRAPHGRRGHRATSCRPCARRCNCGPPAGEVAHALRDVWGIYQPHDGF